MEWWVYGVVVLVLAVAWQCGEYARTYMVAHMYRHPRYGIPSIGAALDRASATADASPQQPHQPTVRVLLVIAHPDDESMFFVPVLRDLQRRRPTVHVTLLCLSNGAFTGPEMSAIRRRELRAAAAHLGFAPADVLLPRPTPTPSATAKADDDDDGGGAFDELPDGPRHDWSAERVLAIVTPVVRARSITHVLTFDDTGVSGHPNHIALYRALQRGVTAAHAAALSSAASASPSAAVFPECYALRSEAMAVKYLGAVSVLFAARRASNAVAAHNKCTVSGGGDTACGANPVASDRDGDVDSAVRARHDATDAVAEKRLYYYCAPDSVDATRVAMQLHASQYVWFRRLFVRFASYSYVNAFHRIVPLATA